LDNRHGHLALARARAINWVSNAREPAGAATVATYACSPTEGFTRDWPPLRTEVGWLSVDSLPGRGLGRAAKPQPERAWPDAKRKWWRRLPRPPRTVIT